MENLDLILILAAPVGLILLLAGAVTAVFRRGQRRRGLRSVAGGAAMLAGVVAALALEDPGDRAARHAEQAERAAERRASQEAEAVDLRAREAVRAQGEAFRAANEKRAGLHCLSGWSGAHRGVVEAVVGNLRDTDSFEHIETRIAPVDGAGLHTLVMTYRARNQLGGMNVGTVTALVQNDGCGFQITASVEE